MEILVIYLIGFVAYIMVVSIFKGIDPLTRDIARAYILSPIWPIGLLVLICYALKPLASVVSKLFHIAEWVPKEDKPAKILEPRDWLPHEAGQRPAANRVTARPMTGRPTAPKKR